MTDEEYIKHPLDALGNPIVIGGTYGYTQSANGHSSASVGTVTQFTSAGSNAFPIDISTETISVGI